MNPIDPRQATEYIRAMRCLPPGASLPTPEADTERELLQDLIGLDDDIDCIHWLMDFREEIASRLAFRAILNAGFTFSRTACDLPAMGGRLPASQLLRSPAELDQPSLTGDDSISQRALEAACRQLRGLRVRPFPLRDRVDAGGDELVDVLISLLYLPENSPPLIWLMSQHAELAARLALRELVKSLRMREPAEIGGQTSIPVARDARAGVPGLEIHLLKLGLGDRGLRLSARAEIFLPAVPLLQECRRMLVMWPGFDRLEDDLGYRYLLWSSNVGTTGSPRGKDWQVGHWEAYFYPRVAPMASTLIFSSQPVRVSMFCSRSLDGRPHAGAADLAEELLWTASLKSE